jgi:hypothetical protein
VKQVALTREGAGYVLSILDYAKEIWKLRLFTDENSLQAAIIKIQDPREDQDERQSILCDKEQCKDALHQRGLR